MCELLILSKKGFCLLIRGFIIFTDLEELVSFTSLRILRSWPPLEQWSWCLFASKNPMWYCNSPEQNEFPKKAQKTDLIQYWPLQGSYCHRAGFTRPGGSPPRAEGWSSPCLLCLLFCFCFLCLALGHRTHAHRAQSLLFGEGAFSG